MFIPDNKLEYAILRSYDDASYTPEFYRLFLDSEVLFIIAGENPVIPKIHNAGEKTGIQSIEIDGIYWTPIFSSLKMLQEFNKTNCSYGTLKARDFFTGNNEAYVILDPGLEKSWRFSPKMIHDLLDGSIFQPPHSITMKKATTMQVRTLASPPRELIDALTKLFARNANVLGAYFVEYYNPEVNEPAHPLIGIEVKDNYDKIVGEAGLITESIVQNKYIVDFMQLKRDVLMLRNKSDLGRHILEGVKPFYQKKKFGGLF
jgi:hypothetical protein